MKGGWLLSIIRQACWLVFCARFSITLFWFQLFYGQFNLIHRHIAIIIEYLLYVRHKMKSISKLAAGHNIVTTVKLKIINLTTTTTTVKLLYNLLLITLQLIEVTRKYWQHPQFTMLILSYLFEYCAFIYTIIHSINTSIFELQQK